MTGTPSTNAPLQLLVLEGDGIGREICAATVQVLDAASRLFGFALAYEQAEIGFTALEKQGTTFPEAVFEAAKRADGIILGPVSHNEYPPAEKGGLNPSGQLRKRLDLYANIRPARSRRGFRAALRQAARPRGGAREHRGLLCRPQSMHRRPRRDHADAGPCPLVAQDHRARLSLRIAEAAFALAMQPARRKVTAVHKANVLRISDGLFLECARAVAARFPEVAYEEKIIDAMAALLVRDAGVFDVIVTTNMFGDILSDQASEISGSLGLAGLRSMPAASTRWRRHSTARRPTSPARTAPIPASLIGSAAMLLDLGLGERRGDERACRAPGP